LADVLPTLVDYLQLPTTDSRPIGHSLRPLIEGESPPAWHPVSAWGANWSRQSYREGDLKVRFADGEVELYDLGRDPSEQSPLAADTPAHRRFIRRARRSLLEARQTAFSDTGPEPAVLPRAGDFDAAKPEGLEDRALEQLRALGHVD
jgi:hypothetical protein